MNRFAKFCLSTAFSIGMVSVVTPAHAAFVEVSGLPSSFDTDFFFAARASHGNWDAAIWKDGITSPIGQATLYSSVPSSGVITSQFTFEYDGSVALFSITDQNGDWKSLTYTPDASANVNDFYLHLKAAEYSYVLTSSVGLSNGSFTTPIAVAEGEQKFFRIDESVPFTLSGTVTYAWDATRPLTKNELAFYIKGGHTSVPEPGTLSLLLVGSLSLIGFAIRKKS